MAIFKYSSMVLLTVQRPQAGDHHFSATDVKITLRRKGFNVRMGRSHYVGHMTVLMSFDRVTELRAALKLMKEYGYIKSIQDAYEAAMFCKRRGISP